MSCICLVYADVGSDVELNITSFENVFRRGACNRACACLRASLLRLHIHFQVVILINEKVECMSFVDISCDM